MYLEHLASASWDCLSNLVCDFYNLCYYVLAIGHYFWNEGSCNSQKFSIFVLEKSCGKSGKSFQCKMILQFIFIMKIMLSKIG